jgi:hypothetical protein
MIYKILYCYLSGKYCEIAIIYRKNASALLCMTFQVGHLLICPEAAILSRAEIFFSLKV